MKKLFKKLLAVATAATMLVAMSVTAFAADESAGTQLTNPKLVKTDGSDLTMGMGTAVVDSATMYDDGTVVVTLKSAEILVFTGTVTQASYVLGGANLVSGGTMLLDSSRATALGSSGLNGIVLESLGFTFTPFSPPGMPNPTSAAFTCDQFK